MATRMWFVVRLCVAAIGLLALGSGGESVRSVKGEPRVPTHERVRERYGKLPLSFEPNEGQTDARVDFLARAGGYTMFLTRGAEAVLVLGGSAAQSESAQGCD